MSFSSPQVNRPARIKNIEEKILEKTKDLQQSICKTKAALNKSQAHKKMNSFPACLHTTLKISVAAPEQPSTDDKVATIVHDYKAKLLDVLIEARQVELNRLVQAHTDFAHERMTRIDTFLAQLLTANLAVPDQSTLNIWTRKFMSASAHATEQVNMHQFLTEHAKQTKQHAQQIARAEAAIKTIPLIP
jgi:hypothetical protein